MLLKLLHGAGVFHGKLEGTLHEAPSKPIAGSNYRLELSILHLSVIPLETKISFIGTIGHVAHGKSTLVKAISGVQVSALCTACTFCTNPYPARYVNMLVLC